MANHGCIRRGLTRVDDVTCRVVARASSPLARLALREW